MLKYKEYYAENKKNAQVNLAFSLITLFMIQTFESSNLLVSIFQLFLEFNIRILS